MLMYSTIKLIPPFPWNYKAQPSPKSKRVYTYSFLKMTHLPLERNGVIQMASKGSWTLNLFCLFIWKRGLRFIVLKKVGYIF